ncbi:branched-chain amino acid ABC transporter permease [Pseudonocardia nigra]|uniref:branched-chain amino acid ABC transporter permease n=1 Tax=Pseudonocardia nigra TaxID=1921578 RepID=UPI001C5CF9AB|nr:branched-chain amino acid ABC transporter permease [Pseudonocardia nigra]
MSDFLSLLVNGASVGMIYALVAVGFVIIFRATRVLNFAHGEFMTVAAYLSVTLTLSVLALPFVAAVGVAVVVTAVIGVLVFALLMRPLLGEALWAPVMVTIGLTVVAQSVIKIIWHGNPEILRPPWPRTGVHIPGADILVSNYVLATIVIAGVFFALLIAFFRYVGLGRQMRAAAENPRLASWSGVNVMALFAGAWAIAGFAAALAGVAVGVGGIVTAELGAIGLRAIPAAILGGLDSVSGALIAALIVGFVEVAAAEYISSSTRDIAAFCVMLAVLLVRPSGLLGSPEIKRI